MRELEFRAMNCDMALVLDVVDVGVQDALLEATMQQVPEWFEHWEQTFSRFRPDSELNQLNASSGQVFIASKDLYHVVQLALSSARLYDGLVTPLVLDALIASGYDKSFELMAAQLNNSLTSIATPQASSTQYILSQIKLDAARCSIELPVGVRLDLGGFVKGWCADVVVHRLAQFAPALMDAGGDIAIGDAMQDGGDWHIGMVDPLSPERDLMQIHVAQGGVATSGRDHRQWMQNGHARHHIIDPRTSSSASTDVLSVTVIAPNTQQAEWASKMILILGTDLGLNCLKQFDTHGQYAACVVLEDGRVRMNERFQSFVCASEDDRVQQASA